MNIKAQIKKVIDVDVETDDFEALRACPGRYVRSGQDLGKLKDLLLLITILEEEGVESDDIC